MFDRRILLKLKGLRGQLGFILLAICWVATTAAEELAAQQSRHKMAISLSYDDGLNSQLDNVVPALNKYNLKASFYLTLASPVVRERLHEWRSAALQGHELGNHTLYHPCRASLPGREWVPNTANLDAYSLGQIVQEVEIANSFLYAIDGRQQRTFTPPCGDLQVKDASNYLPYIAGKFVAIKGFENFNKDQMKIWVPSAVSVDDLISRIELEAKLGTRLLNIIFHGIGGDHLAVSAEVHEQLLVYLAANQERYSTGTYIDLMRTLRKEDLPEI